MDYKKYSLENLENWLHDALSCGEASPHEIYSVIRKVVQDEYNYHKEQSQKCLGLLELLSGHRPVKSVDNGMRPWGHSDLEYLACNKDDSSPECQGAWNDFWEGVDDEVREDILTNGYEWTPATDKDIQHSKYYYEYNRNDPNRKAPMYHPV